MTESTTARAHVVPAGAAFEGRGPVVPSQGRLPEWRDPLPRSNWTWAAARSGSRNPDKVYFAERGITKLDVVQYFLSVGDGILGALRDRPTTLERWPGGVFEGAKLSTRADNRGDAFYQKRVPQYAPDYVETARDHLPQRADRPTRSARPSSPWSRGARTSAP